eukprot:COSAG02_NODE_61596_length_268_cov_0.615385_1_plen_40_part_10
MGEEGPLRVRKSGEQSRAAPSLLGIPTGIISINGIGTRTV